MFCTTSPQALALFLGVVGVLVSEYGTSATRPAAHHPFNIVGTQTAAHQPLTCSFPSSELAWSMVVNQMTLLKMLNESSTIYSLRESDLQELRDMKLELNATHEAAIEEINNMRTAVINESHAKWEEAKEELLGLKEAARNETKQLQELMEATMTTLQNAIETTLARKEELKQELDNMITAAMTKSDARREEAKEELLGWKEAAVNEIKQLQEAAITRLQDAMETTLAEIIESKQEIVTVKNQSLNEMNAALNRTNARAEESKEELLTVKNEALNEVNVNTEKSKQELQNVKKRLLLALKKVHSGRKSYRAFMDKVTHSKAVSICEELDATLAVPMNENENLEIYELVTNNTAFQSYWIGVDDKLVEGVWMDPATGERLDFMNFDESDGQPDNHGNEDCVHVRITMKWNDVECENYNAATVCEFIE